MDHKHALRILAAVATKESSKPYQNRRRLTVSESNQSESVLSGQNMRRLLLALLFLGLVGTGAELLLLQHTESLWELIPLVLIGLTLVILTWHVMVQRPASIRALQGTMGLFLIAGFAGLVLHYQSNMEFKLETNPSLAGWALFWAVLTGKSPPALAPGAMIQLGLLGFAYAYQHPALIITDMLKSRNKGERNEE